MKEEVIVLPAREIVQLVANPKEKIDRLAQALQFLLGEEARVPQILEAPHRVMNSSNPERGMHVPKTSGPLLDVRFLQIHRAAILRVSCRPLLELCLDVGLSTSSPEAPLQQCFHFIVDGLVTRQQVRF
jgi:hypothetical protein